MKKEDVFNLIQRHIEDAYKKWPNDVNDPIHSSCISAEEMLEAGHEFLNIGLNMLRTGHDVTYYENDLKNMQKETIQSLSTCVRILINFNRFVPQKRYIGENKNEN